MSYRIRYEVRRRPGRWAALGMLAGMGVWVFTALWPVWKSMAAGEGGYDALARFVGEMIRGAH